MTYEVIDLHCDLLAYLAEETSPNAPLNHASNCSLPLLKEGGVTLQTLAVFTETGCGSTKAAQKQISCYEHMLNSYASLCEPFRKERGPRNEKLRTILAVENASGLLEEDEDLSEAFRRLDEEEWLYISLTWNGENRFGGGNQTQVGLKRDGELLLEYIAGKSIAIDLSHTSDPLAYDILNYIHKKGLNLKPIASHSNCRAVKDCPRNLPDEFVKEIISLGGVIGLNFVRHFVGDHPENFIDHIKHLFSLGGEDSVVLGADFFGGIPLPDIDHLRPFYQKDFSDASCYPHFLSFLQDTFSSNQVEKIASKNGLAFLDR